jgi:hypothetical protein
VLVALAIFDVLLPGVRLQQFSGKLSVKLSMELAPGVMK